MAFLLPAPLTPSSLPPARRPRAARPPPSCSQSRPTGSPDAAIALGLGAGVATVVMITAVSTLPAQAFGSSGAAGAQADTHERAARVVRQAPASGQGRFVAGAATEMPAARFLARKD